MDLFIPDVYQQSVFTINYKKLKKNGIKCLLFDLDNTLMPYKATEPSKRIKELFNVLERDFKLIILSNSSKDKLRPYKEKLNVDTAYKCFKPLKKKYLKIMELYNYKETEIACIGDQILTDILGANRMGLTSILVNRISSYETLPTRINRSFEKIILNILSRKRLLNKGEYYD